MATCYRQVDGGTISAFSGVTQCSNSTSAAGYTPCCFNGDLCLEDSLCYNSDPPSGGVSTGYYEALCSDSTFKDSSCSHKCTAFTKGDAIYNPNNSEWSCCGADSNGDPNCGDPTTVTFSAPAPSVLLAEATGSAFSTSSISASSSGTSITTSSATGRGTSATSSPSSSISSATPSATSSSSSSSGLSTGAAAGIGVAGAVIAVSIIGVIFWFLMQRRRRRSQDPASKPLSDQWQGHGNLPPYEKSPADFSSATKPTLSPAQQPLAYAEMGESDVKANRQQTVHELAS